MSTIPATIRVTTRTCHLCGSAGALDLTRAEVDALSRGLHAQDAMPERSRAEREQVISGTHPACWADMFGDGE